MNCPTCQARLKVLTHFCPECGAAIRTRTSGPEAGKRRTDALAGEIPASKPAYTPEQLARMRQAAETEIDNFLRRVGVADPQSLVDEDGWRRLKLGSAQGRAGIIESEGELFLQADALVMAMPSDHDLILPLMRELLEINSQLAGTERVALAGQLVIVVSTRPLLELRREDFARCIHRVLTMADHMDDYLINKYGGTTRARSNGGETHARKRKAAKLNRPGGFS